MLNLDTAVGRLPLVLLVDSQVATRHALWRALHRAFGVLEADSVESAMAWLARRPDIDALVVRGEFADGTPEELAEEWVNLHLPAARRPVIVASNGSETRASTSAPQVTHADPEDLRGIVASLAAWLSSHDKRSARLLLRDADRLLF
jgi:DNA-binding NtrC family response regulator